MKALIWNKDKTIEFIEKNKPQIINETDAIIKVTYSSICTSDLHIIEGFVPKAKENTVLGHELVGIVEEIGSSVKKFKKGDRVSVNCESFCGECFFCKRGYVNNCENGGWLIGCSIDGAQAEFVRIPYADNALNKIPDNVSFKDALFVGDILASAYWGAELCEINNEDIVAVIGAGPVGLLVLQCLKCFNPKKIISIDINEDRLNIAKKEGLADYCINPLKADIQKEILNLTSNRGADKVIECAGAKNTFEMAWKIARSCAIVAVVAMYEKNQKLPLPKMYGKNLTFKTGGVQANKCDLLLDLISKKKLNTNFLITHEFKFDEIESAYELFKDKNSGCLKIAIKYDY